MPYRLAMSPNHYKSLFVPSPLGKLSAKLIDKKKISYTPPNLAICSVSASHLLGTATSMYQILRSVSPPGLLRGDHIISPYDLTICSVSASHLLGTATSMYQILRSVSPPGLLRGDHIISPYDLAICSVSASHLLGTATSLRHIYSPSWARTNNPAVNSRVLYH